GERPTHVVVAGVAFGRGPDHDHHLAAGRGGVEAPRQVVERSPRRLLVELRQLTADAGSPVAAARPRQVAQRRRDPAGGLVEHGRGRPHRDPRDDRKSTRLNSSHVKISYAVFCLKKKIKTTSPL